MNRKERRLALKSALAYKVIDKELIVVDELKFATSKTREMVNLLTKLNIEVNKVLVVVEELTDNVILSARNLANVKVITFDEVNAFDVVSADNMLIEASAIDKLEEVLSRE
jgi:large subunit ribosomal protein L4